MKSKQNMAAYPSQESERNRRGAMMMKEQRCIMLINSSGFSKKIKSTDHSRSQNFKADLRTCQGSTGRTRSPRWSGRRGHSGAHGGCCKYQIYQHPWRWWRWRCEGLRGHPGCRRGICEIPHPMIPSVLNDYLSGNRRGRSGNIRCFASRKCWWAKNTGRHYFRENR